MATASAPDRTAPSTGDGAPTHLYCCDINLALCGEDLTGQQEVEVEVAEETICPMCDALDPLPCPRCGWQPI